MAGVLKFRADKGDITKPSMYKDLRIPVTSGTFVDNRINVLSKREFSFQDDSQIGHRTHTLEDFSIENLRGNDRG
jgi:hypothetical protein